jgi:hypothetical protein
MEAMLKEVGKDQDSERTAASSAEKTDASRTTTIAELSDLQLALVGGGLGIGSVV